MTVKLSITTDYLQDTGDPEPYLRAIADAGFTHIHWCHHWNTDFAYDKSEIAQIRTWLKHLHLGLTDLHASAGREKDWTSPREYQRLAGVALVVNRMEMTARLGSDVVILHIPPEPAPGPEGNDFWDHTRRSLDALQKRSAKLGVRIALENGASAESWNSLRRVFSEYGDDFVGLCYDSGHGNLLPDGLDRLEAVADRLISLHLHDNDGTADHHWLPFMGTVNWLRLMAVIASSSYQKWVSLEVSQPRSGYEDQATFLHDARTRASQLQAHLSTARHF
jgi:sugar phosphate isomerase/epimerase